MFVPRERLKPASELKISVMWQYIPDTQYGILYVKKLKRVDEWHVGKNSL